MTLRERLKAGVKAELRDMAFALFQERGFDDVSVAEIAEKAGVSQRTFFRYFASKEDVIIEGLDNTGPMIRAGLLSAPLDLPPLRALRRAFLSIDRTHSPVERGAEVMSLAVNSARLRAGINEHRLVWEAHLADALADRMGVRIEEDFRPSVWAAVVMAAVTSAHYHSIIINRKTSPQNPAELIEAAFDALEALLGTDNA